MRFLLVSVVLLASARSPLGAQRASSRSVDVSAAISDVRYEVAFDRTRARTHTLRVTTRFLVLGSEPVLLSLPAWTPGAYELSNFARLVSGFTATGDDRPLHWDKLDYDTWRITPNGSKQVTVAFDFLADSLDNAMAWTRDDFAFFNGTNLFLYPEGRDAGFSATVTIETEVEWKVATGMSSAAAPVPGTPRRYSASSYHDLVDMPFFVGAFDVDSQQVQAKWVRLASYPAGQLAGTVLL